MEVLIAVATWPVSSFAQIQAGVYIPSAVALGFSYYYWGVPSMDNGMQALAMQYAGTGGVLLGVSMAMGPASKEQVSVGN